LIGIIERRVADGQGERWSSSVQQDAIRFYKRQMYHFSGASVSSVKAKDERQKRK
jgi:hypothetical protein